MTTVESLLASSVLGLYFFGWFSSVRLKWEVKPPQKETPHGLRRSLKINVSMDSLSALVGPVEQSASSADRWQCSLALWDLSKYDYKFMDFTLQPSITYPFSTKVVRVPVWSQRLPWYDGGTNTLLVYKEEPFLSGWEGRIIVTQDQLKPFMDTIFKNQSWCSMFWLTQGRKD